MRYFIPILALVLMWGCKTPAEGGDPSKMSAKQHRKAAIEANAMGKILEAAYHNEQAWLKNPKLTDQLYAAAEGYYQAKDFRKASELFRKTKDDKDGKYPLTSLYLARSLKQDGKFDEASREFVYFIGTYTGTDKDKLTYIVQNELRGCNLGLMLSNDTAAMRSLNVDLLSNNVNSSETEFGPIPFGDDVLYYSSTAVGMAKIYRAQFVGGNWTKAEPAKGLPTRADAHVCNGTFSPDGQRFYFNICESVLNEGKVTSRCDIFMTKRAGGSWTEPVKLRDYINMVGTTTTQPSVMHDGGKEYLYFSSSREGGQGGLDLWVCSRDLATDDIDFTMPENLGAVINTLGDEITPWYSTSEGALFFSSNGHVSIGGYDILRAEGRPYRWSPPENIKMPYNSCNDDYGFVKNNLGDDGYFVSNRLHGAEKVSTRDTDLFRFSKKEEQLKAMGRVTDALSKNNLSNVKVNLYELMPNGTKRLLTSNDSKDGNFTFTLLKGRKFRVEAEKPEYYIAAFDVDPANNSQLNSLNIVMERAGSTPSPDPVKPKPDPKPDPVKPNPTPSKPKPDPVKPNPTPVKPNPTPGSTVVIGNANKRYMKPANEAAEVQTDAPIVKGTYYKIQLTAVKDPKTMAAKLAPLQAQGDRFDTELIIAKGLTRVLLADFMTFADAQKALANVKSGGFADAYIVRYENGVRIRNGQ